MLLEIEMLDLVSRHRIELTVADDEKTCVWHATDDEGGGVDEVPLTRMWNKVGNTAHERCAVGEPELLVEVDPGCRPDVVKIDPFMDDRGAIGRCAVLSRHRPGECRRANEALHLTMLPS